ncbi:tetratricopeptide repeat protein [Fusobacterium mortiferum]|uniref:tetratricopeptide repeat protein n=1 Tax=Fusobacterium mortiferum TaxID=850 RepID=UPI00195D7F52|nr:tetratricopeptide repeat protein [Fusobacterium mortiferum]
MKKRYFLLALMFAMGVSSFASERDDLAFVDELYKQKKFDMAIVESKSFLDKYPNSKYNKSIQDRIAKVYFLTWDYQNAIKYFKILLMNNDLKEKEKNEIRYYLVRCYAGIGDKKSSDEYLKLIDSKNEYYEKAIYDTGTTYLSNENYPLAEEAFQKVIVLNGKYYNEAILSMALLSYNKGDYNRSIAYLNEYAQLKGKKNMIFMNYLLGSSYYKLDQVDLASRYFEEAVKEDKESPYGKKAILNLIEIYSNKGEIAKVEEKIELIKGTTDYNEGMRILGDSFATKGEYSKAIECYNKTDDFSNPKLLYSYGFSLYKLDNLKDAQTYFESLKSSSYYNQAIYYIFAIDYKLGNYKKIIQNRAEVKKVNVNQQDMENINIIIANSAYEVGDYKLSREYYSKNYNLKPNKESLYRIIVIDNKLEDLEDIKAKFSEYKSKFSTDTQYKKNIYLSVGEVYYKKGMLKESSQVYKEYLSTQKDFDILNNLVTVLLAQQNYSEMMTYLEEGDNSPNSVYLKGIASMGMGKYSDANGYYLAVEQDSTTSPELMEKVKFNKLRNSFLWQKYSDAIKYGEEYLTQYPNGENRAEVLDKTAISYFRLDNVEKSKEYYTQLQGILNYSEYASFQIADLYYAQGKYDEALVRYKEIFTKYPNGIYSESANYWYLNSLINLGKFDEFEKEKEFFLKKYPKSNMRESLYILTGQLYERKGEKQNSLATYEKLYDISKDTAVKEETATKILDIQLATNKLDEAVKYIAGIGNIEIKSYYNSQLYEKQGKKAEALKEYETLFTGTKYKDFAGVNLGDYYFNNKNYEEAKVYYSGVESLESSPYKDYVLYQLSNIDELEGKNESALRGYTKGYVLFNGEYSNLSKLKAAQLNEKLGKEEDAIKLYKELYSLPKFQYRSFILEKMIFYTLKSGNKIEAKKYYNELQKIDEQASVKYNQFFN